MGLIAGNGQFPLLVAEEAAAQGRPVVAVAIKGETDPALERLVDRFHWVHLGQIKKTISILRDAGVREAVMAGQVKHVQIYNLLHLDGFALKIMAGLKDKKTDTLLTAVADEFEKSGIKFLSSIAYLEGYLVPPGRLGKKGPTSDQQKDIDFGFKTAKAVAGLDLGQTVCVKGQAVVAVEAMEGTDACISRAGEITGGGFTVVKVSKPRQDFRFDVPVIGRRTLDSLKGSKAAVLGVEAGKTLFFNRSEFMEKADSLGLVVMGV